MTPPTFQTTTRSSALTATPQEARRSAFELHLHPEVAVRFFGDRAVLLSRRNGIRRIWGDPVVSFLRPLVDRFGVAGLHALGSVDPNDPAALGDRLGAAASGLPAGAVETVRFLFDTLDQGHPRSRPELLGQVPGLMELCEEQQLPLIALCEITHRCNLRCRHCYILPWIEGPRPAHPDTGQIFETLEQLAEMGCLDVTLSGGEATLQKDYRRLVSRAKELHLHTVLKTNGTTFTAANVAAYAEDPAHETHLSLYGADAETHDAFTACSGSFERTVAALGKLGDAGIRCLVFTIVWSGNSRQLAAMKDLAESLGHGIDFSPVIHGRLNGDPSPVRLRVPPEERRRLEEEGWIEPFEPSPCVAGATKIKVGADGEVAICELLPGKDLGNAHREALSEVWRRRRTRRFADAIVQLSTRERDDDGRTVLSCPGINLVTLGTLRGRTIV